MNKKIKLSPYIASVIEDLKDEDIYLQQEFDSLKLRNKGLSYNDLMKMLYDIVIFEGYDFYEVYNIKYEEYINLQKQYLKHILKLLKKVALEAREKGMESELEIHIGGLFLNIPGLDINKYKYTNIKYGSYYDLYSMINENFMKLEKFEKLGLENLLRSYF